MTAVRLALALLTRNGIISLVALAGWPRWRWASRAVDRCQVMAEALQSREGVGA